MPEINVMNITIDEVIEAYGEHYVNEGQNMSNLHMLPFEEFGTQSAGTLVETDQTVLREANVRVEEVLQPYQVAVTSKGGVSFLPVNIPLYPVKVDVSVEPRKLVKSWLGFLTSNGRTPEDYPFVPWLVNDYIIRQAKEDMELKAVYKGIYQAPADGEAGPASNTMDGIEKHLKDLIAAGKVEEVVTGAIPSSAADFVTQVENFIRSIPERYRYNYAMELNMSRTLRDKFKQGMRDKYNVNYQQTEQLLRVMDFENVTVVGRASMMGKNRYWMTTKENLLFPVKGFSNSNGFDLQKRGRVLDMITDWWMGVGFVQPELIFTSNQD